MTDLQELLRLEEDFWKGDAAFYAENLTADSIMLFPGLGTLERDEIIAGIEGGQRWESVKIRDARLLQLSDRAVVLSYAAEATMQGADSPYTALVGSAYRHENGAWKLAFHQQSPLG